MPDLVERFRQKLRRLLEDLDDTLEITLAREEPEEELGEDEEVEELLAEEIDEEPFEEEEELPAEEADEVKETEESEDIGEEPEEFDEDEKTYMTQEEWLKEHRLSAAGDVSVDVKRISSSPGEIVDEEILDYFLSQLHVPTDISLSDRVDEERKLREYLRTGETGHLEGAQVFLTYKYERIKEAFGALGESISFGDIENTQKVRSVRLLFERLGGRTHEVGISPLAEFLRSAAQTIFSGLPEGESFDEHWETFLKTWVIPLLGFDASALRAADERLINNILKVATDAYEYEGAGGAERAKHLIKGEISQAISDIVIDCIREWKKWSSDIREAILGEGEEGGVVYEWVHDFVPTFVAFLKRNPSVDELNSLWDALKNYVDNLENALKNYASNLEGALRDYVANLAVDNLFKKALLRALAGALYGARNELLHMEGIQLPPDLESRLRDITKEAGINPRELVVLSKSILKPILMRKLIELVSR